VDVSPVDASSAVTLASGGRVALACEEDVAECDVLFASELEVGRAECCSEEGWAGPFERVDASDWVAVLVACLGVSQPNAREATQASANDRCVWFRAIVAVGQASTCSPLAASYLTRG
jgi:hypothetical protein